MQLQATTAAQFFLQSEYFDVQLERDQLILSARESKTTIRSQSGVARLRSSVA